MKETFPETAYKLAAGQRYPKLCVIAKRLDRDNMRRHGGLGLSLRTNEFGLAIAAALAIFGLGFCDAVQASTITTFDPPESVGTYPTGINASGSITGYFFDSSGNTHSFLRAPDGAFATIDVQGATCGTYAQSINRSGMIVGNAQDGSCNFHGFIRAPDGTITLLDVSGAAGTDASSVNNGGIITGEYIDSSNYVHGFVRATDGTFTSFDPEGSIVTGPASINKTGVIAGSYEDNSNIWHGFLRATDGTITTFDAPHATGTYVDDLNDVGEIVGYYLLNESTVHAFLRKTSGKIVEFDPVGSTDAVARAINNHRVATGFADGYGFVRAADGTLATFNIPNSLGVTNIGGINGNGAIIGSFADLNQINVHGFLRTP